MLSRDKYCILIVLSPKWSLAQYFDSGDLTTKKDYTRIKGVLDEALEGYAQKGGHFDKKGECIRTNGKHGFKHVTTFPCVKQPADSVKEAFYVLHHLKGFVRDAETMRLPSSIREWAKMAGEINDADLREDFHRIQMKLSEIIIEDVNTSGGSLHSARGLPQREIEDRLDMQGDTRTWTTKDCYKPFPAPCKKKSP